MNNNDLDEVNTSFIPTDFGLVPKHFWTEHQNLKKENSELKEQLFKKHDQKFDEQDNKITEQDNMMIELQENLNKSLHENDNKNLLKDFANIYRYFRTYLIPQIIKENTDKFSKDFLNIEPEQIVTPKYIFNKNNIIDKTTKNDIVNLLTISGTDIKTIAQFMRLHVLRNDESDMSIYEFEDDEYVLQILQKFKDKMNHIDKYYDLFQYKSIILNFINTLETKILCQ